MRWLLFASLAAVSVFNAALGCAERTRAEPAAPPSSVSPVVAPTPAAAAPSSSAAAPALSVAAAPVALAPAVASAAPPESQPEGASAEPPLTSPDGKTLPQTEDRPSVDSAAFKVRILRVVEAIRSDEPKGALSSFFPLLAYKEVKAVEKPERDYQYRLVRHFERDIHEYHKALGADAAQAKFEGIDVPEAQARWMKPGQEGNRLGYYRVLRSRLRFTKANGKAVSFELTSMISWRGEWYVVHLHGFE